MSFSKPRRVTVATTATRLDDSTDPFAGGALAIQNLGTVTVYIGKPDVLTTDGFPIPAGATATLNQASINPAVGMFGIVASGTAAVAILQVNF